MTFTRRCCVVLFLALLLAASLPARAWGPEGHQIVAAIADLYLSETARKRVAELLDGRSMAEVANWADTLRDKPEYEHTKTWHYLNLPDDAPRVSLEEHCPETGCVVSAIYLTSRTLTDPEADPAARHDALKFLIHFIGDVHQPLHVSRAHDRGGNDIRVEFQGSPTNLHRLWDSGLIVSTREPWPEYAGRLIEAIDGSQIEAWSAGTPEDWGTESHELALKVAYRSPPSGVISETYARESLQVIDRRLTLAGLRLAAHLNKLFAE